MSDEPQKPRPKVRALGIHDLRKLVSARHKMVLSTVLSLEEAVTLVEDEYKVDHDSALTYVQWLRGERPGQEPENKQAIERIHVVTDPRTGDERYVDTQPGSIPPRPAPKGKR